MIAVLAEKCATSDLNWPGAVVVIAAFAAFAVVVWVMFR